MTPFKLSVVAPDRLVAELDVASLVAPGIAGYFGVWKGHQPMIAALKPGLIEYISTDNQNQYVAIGGGFAEINGESVTILADDAHLATEIDVAKAEGELEEAMKALRGESSTMTTQEATQAVEKAMVRIKAAKRAN
jgi:F-type H+-transporting ATPase subunit epsilon